MNKPDLSGARTIGEAWLGLRLAFRAARIETADLDARLLAAGVAGLEPHQLITGGDIVLDDDVRARLVDAAGRRLDGMPVHRILGEREFYGLRLGLSQATLEPRPDTETLVDAVLPLVRQVAAAKGSCSIVDLGIGTGAIGLALIAECPQARCLGIDISAEAVETALENARRNDLCERYHAVVGNWLSDVEARFDLIVSNPPYIPTADLALLAREVTEHDPAIALDGGSDGGDAYRAIAAQAADRLEQGGHVALEIGIGQNALVSGIFAGAGFETTGIFADLGGRERVLLFEMATGQRPTVQDF
ncbi:peptide chain release factor N(5)-glutamine methyltransferase [Hoeflea sp. YIM 152468]|uniref:peptide chain release factor N(5)-glutamine methyltransferase n=1 Tax=Hoeflea sp. YIM 152468 TaxID=3031759 RepID=UPI0023DC80BE|nr:peptide chain release factor N(5)-glutamine methyltransferase [Hoeflea sp. YIM 152468]MDF1608009.1 peptide chain release factor N(5)-glutamine methyltransferase [Hoeflea sp. YIM 152468]